MCVPCLLEASWVRLKHPPQSQETAEASNRHSRALVQQNGVHTHCREDLGKSYSS